MDGGRVRERLDIPRFWWRGAERTRPPEAVGAPWAVCQRCSAARPAAATLGAKPTAELVSVPSPALATVSDREFVGADELIAEARARPAHRATWRAIWPCRHNGDAGRATTFIVFGNVGGKVQTSAPISEQVDRLMIMAGLGVDEIRLSGHRYTIDNDVFAALALARADIAAPLQLGRRAPPRRSVVVGEPRDRDARAAEHRRSAHQRAHADRGLAAGTAATWSMRRAVCSRASRRRRCRHLPRIAGAGAPEAAGTLVAALHRHPEIARRVTAERVGQRRWSLDIDKGSRIHLPADGEAAALARLIRIAATMAR